LPPTNPVTVPAVAVEERSLPQKRRRVVVERRQEPVEDNLCTRHKLRKVYTNDGRSWRCR
jgi:hypothetical protein